MRRVLRLLATGVGALAAVVSVSVAGLHAWANDERTATVAHPTHACMTDADLERAFRHGVHHEGTKGLATR